MAGPDSAGRPAAAASSAPAAAAGNDADVVLENASAVERAAFQSWRSALLLALRESQRQAAAAAAARDVAEHESNELREAGAQLAVELRAITAAALTARRSAGGLANSVTNSLLTLCQLRTGLTRLLSCWQPKTRWRPHLQSGGGRMAGTRWCDGQRLRCSRKWARRHSSCSRR